MEPTPQSPPPSTGRPWIKWVALGCGGLLVLGLLVALGLVTLVMGGIKKSDVFQQAMEAVQASPEAAASLGEPIRAGRFVSGSIEVAGPGGEASLAIPVRGPEGRGTLYAEATKAAGRWSFTTLELELRDTGERIDLLAGPGAWVDEEEPSPEPSRAPRAAPTPTGPPSIGSPGFATSVDGLDNPTHLLSAGIPTVYALIEYANLAADQPIGAYWYVEGELFSEQHVAPRDIYGPRAASDGSIYLSWTLDDGFPPGDYRLDLWLGDRRVTSAGFVVE